MGLGIISLLHIVDTWNKSPPAAEKLTNINRFWEKNRKTVGEKLSF